MLFVLLPALVGCGENANQVAVPAPVAKVEVKEETAETPIDKVLVAPRPDLRQAIAIYSAGLEQRRSNLLTAMSLNGGTAVLHAMIYRDQSRKEAIDGKPKDYREIRAYHLLPWHPGVVKEEVEFHHTAKPDDYRFRPERICIFEARPEGLRVRVGAVSGWSPFPPDPSVGTVDDRAWSRSLPRAMESEYAIIPADRIKKNSHSGRHFSALNASPSFGAGIRQLPASVAMKETLSVVNYDDYGSTQVDISIECLPIPNPISKAELLALAEGWRKEAASDPMNAAARYYFGWAALFGYGRIGSDDPQRRQIATDAERLVGEACLIESDDHAYAALRRKLIATRIGDTYGKDRDGTLQAAEELLKLHPTSDDCREALAGLRRFPQGKDPPFDDVVIRFLRRSWDWYDDWPTELKRDLDYWKKLNDNGDIRLPAFDALYAEYLAKLPKLTK